MSDCVSLRLGYSYNDNPIDNSQSSFNIASPVTLQHTIYLGGSYRVNDSLTMSLAYLHAFQNTIDGPLVTPFGTVPASSVSSTTSADCLLVGATVQFGPRAATVR
jgi:long-chain fatty acid transport protein